MVTKALSQATIYQVAQLAGGSVATVSRAMRDSDRGALGPGAGRRRAG